MTDQLIILAAGGTGGHVFPAEALSNALLHRDYRLGLVTDSRGQAYGGTLGSVPTYRILAGGIAGRNPLFKLFAILELVLGTFQALAQAAAKSKAFGRIDAAERLADLISTSMKAAP